MIYSVFVGKYSSPKISKNDLKKLNDLGLVGYLFQKDGFYSLKIYSTLNVVQANNVKSNLEKRGFFAFIEEKDVSK